MRRVELFRNELHRLNAAAHACVIIESSIERVLRFDTGRNLITRLVELQMHAPTVPFMFAGNRIAAIAYARRWILHRATIT